MTKVKYIMVLSNKYTFFSVTILTVNALTYMNNYCIPFLTTILLLLWAKISFQFTRLENRCFYITPHSLCRSSSDCWGIRRVETKPVRIRVKIDPPHSLVRRKRRLNWEALRMRPRKLRPRVTVLRQVKDPQAQWPSEPSIGLNFAALHR
jgi:hypothetical protein